MTADDDLARTLCLRQPGSTYRFSLRLAPERELRMTATRNGAAGDGGASAGFSGVAVVDDEGKLVFCAPGDPQRLLWALSEWAKAMAGRLPAAAALIGTGAAAWDGRTSPDLAALAIRRDDTLWSGVATAEPGQVARVLRACAPGVRIWYWLTDMPGSFGLPLLLQPVSGDPNRDFLNALIDFVTPGGPGPAETGIAYATDDGTFQFLGAGLRHAHLEALAQWVRRSAALRPDLARLSGARLLRTVRGRVEEVIDDEALWEGLAPPVSSGG
jgi:hypothetical protein